MRSIYNIQDDIDALKAEMSMVEGMTEEQACRWGNTDSKAEYLEMCEDEIRALRHQFESALDDIEEPQFDILDPAFSSWDEVNAMFA